MKLLIALLTKAEIDPVLTAIHEMGFPATVVDANVSKLTSGRYTLLVGAHDNAVPSVVSALTQLGAPAEPSVGALLPLSDPADIHVADPAVAVTASGSLFVVSVRRFEQFW